LYARLRDESVDPVALYQSRYAGEPFIDVMADATPDTRSVRGSNCCRIAVTRQGRTVIVQAVIDNLIKGASGQAVQNMNLMFGLDETLGLDELALFP
ncbi:MAG: N-acetyl-gamma-glutamyl-phosphate reductase, partial [Armatimonadetes bacterium]|nr:N-acetyl-gamma-glutamyl-phosphate reductase [Armatimonadota bacterium]